MARHVWSVLCERSAIDKDDSQISLLAVTEKLNFHQTPDEYELLETALHKAKGQNKAVPFPANLHLVSMWVRSDPHKPEGPIPVQYSIVAPDGWKFPKVGAEVDLGQSAACRTRWKLDSLLFRGFGFYWISVQSKSGKNWRTHTRIPLEMVKGQAKFPRA